MKEQNYESPIAPQEQTSTISLAKQLEILDEMINDISTKENITCQIYQEKIIKNCFHQTDVNQMISLSTMYIPDNTTNLEYYLTNNIHYQEIAIGQNDSIISNKCYWISYEQSFEEQNQEELNEFVFKNRHQSITFWNIQNKIKKTKSLIIEGDSIDYIQVSQCLNYLFFNIKDFQSEDSFLLIINLKDFTIKVQQVSQNFDGCVLIWDASYFYHINQCSIINPFSKDKNVKEIVKKLNKEKGTILLDELDKECAYYFSKDMKQLYKYHLINQQEQLVAENLIAFQNYKEPYKQIALLSFILKYSKEDALQKMIQYMKLFGKYRNKYMYLRNQFSLCIKFELNQQLPEDWYQDIIFIDKNTYAYLDQNYNLIYYKGGTVETVKQSLNFEILHASQYYLIYSNLEVIFVHDILSNEKIIMIDISNSIQNTACYYDNNINMLQNFIEIPYVLQFNLKTLKHEIIEIDGLSDMQKESIISCKCEQDRFYLLQTEILIIIDLSKKSIKSQQIKTIVPFIILEQVENYHFERVYIIQSLEQEGLYQINLYRPQKGMYIPSDINIVKDHGQLFQLKTQILKFYYYDQQFFILSKDQVIIFGMDLNIVQTLSFVKDLSYDCQLYFEKFKLQTKQHTTLSFCYIDQNLQSVSQEYEETYLSNQNSFTQHSFYIIQEKENNFYFENVHFDTSNLYLNEQFDQIQLNIEQNHNFSYQIQTQLSYEQFINQITTKIINKYLNYKDNFMFSSNYRYLYYTNYQKRKSLVQNSDNEKYFIKCLKLENNHCESQQLTQFKNNYFQRYCIELFGSNKGKLHQIFIDYFNDNDSIEFSFSEEYQQILIEKSEILNKIKADKKVVSNQQIQINYLNDNLILKQFDEVIFLSGYNQIEYVLENKNKIEKIDIFKYLGNFKILNISKTTNASIYQISLMLEDHRYNNNLIVLNWNIKKQQELSLFEIKNISLINIQFNNDIKLNINYILDKNMKFIYDLSRNYRTPINYNVDDTYNQQVEKTLNIIYQNELPLLSENGTCLLKPQYNFYYEQFQYLTVKTYNILNLMYFGNIIQKLNDKNLTQDDILIDQFKCQLPHGYPLRLFDQNNFLILQYLFNKIKNISGSNIIVDMELFCQMVYPDNYGISGLDICIQNNNIKSIEIIFYALTMIKQINISQFILKKHFQTLSNMHLTSFESYLETCFLYHSFLSDPFQIKWKVHSHQVLKDCFTSILTQEYIDYLEKEPNNILDKLICFKYKKKLSLVGKSRQQDQNQIQLKKHMIMTQFESDSLNNDNLENQYSIQNLLEEEQKSTIVKAKINTCMLSNKIIPQFDLNIDSIQEKLFLMSDSDDDNEQNKNESVLDIQKTVDIKVIEFTWIFQGNSGKKFIIDLRKIDNERIFRIDTIKLSIEFLWSRFQLEIIKKIFLPYLFNLIFFIIFSTYGSRFGLVQNNGHDDYIWYSFQYILVVIIALGIIYQIFREIQQMRYLCSEYFKVGWNFLHLVSLLLNIAYIISYFCEVELSKLRILASIAILISWVKIYDFLRIFPQTAAFIRMIVSVINDMKIFSLFMILSFFAIGNSYYVLSKSFIHDPNNPEFLDTLNNFGDALRYGFSFAVGGPNTAGFEYNSYTLILWILFLLGSFLVTIVFMNLLISLMGDTYDNVTSQMDVQKLQEICNIIYEYEFLFNRENLFKNSKYIFVAKVQTSDQKQDQQWSGKISNLKKNFKAQINEVENKIQQSLKKNEEQLNQINDKINQKIDQMNDKMDKKIDQLNDKMDKKKTDQMDNKIDKKIDQMNEKIDELFKIIQSMKN